MRYVIILGFLYISTCTIPPPGENSQEDSEIDRYEWSKPTIESNAINHVINLYNSDEIEKAFAMLDSIEMYPGHGLSKRRQSAIECINIEHRKENDKSLFQYSIAKRRIYRKPR